ncbi:hypothetical protein M153_11121000485, partial [Pseudoloma neurophilia]
MIEYLVDPEIFSQISGENFLEIKTQILKLKYSISTHSAYTSYLRRTYLSNFHLIDEYLYSIEETIKRISVIKPMTNEDKESFKKEIFYEGLPSTLKIEFAAEGSENVEKIITQIRKTEEQIVNSFNLNNSKRLSRPAGT